MKRRTFHFLAILLFVTIAASSFADVPRLINYQGTVTGLSGPLDGNYDLTFSIYADSTGGTALWTELHAASPVSYGLFNVILGRFTAIPDDLFSAVPRWIGVTVGADHEMAPRMRMTAVPWAMRAAIAESSLVSAADDDWAYSGANIYRLTGMVGIGTSTPAYKLDARDEGADAYLHVAGQDDGISGLVLAKGAAYLWYDEAEAEVRLWNAVTGGNAGDITFGTRNLERMRIGRDGQVGIGVMAPTDLLEVAGTAKVNGFKMPAGAANGYVLTSDAGGIGTWQAPTGGGSDGDWTISGSDQYSAVSGNVGIGISSAYSGKLHVKTNSNDNAAYFEVKPLTGLGDSAAVHAINHGQGYGVYGVNQGNNYGALGTTNSGVYGRHNTGTFGYLGGDGKAVAGQSANGTCGYLGSNFYSVNGRHGSSHNEGYLGSVDYGAYAINDASKNYGYIGSNDYGIYGRHDATAHTGILGCDSAGVYGISAQPSRPAVYGRALGATSVGVQGRHTTSENFGRLGTSAYGAYGRNASGSYGFLGGDTTGVYGYTTAVNKAAVYGQGGGLNAYGVRGSHSATQNFGIVGGETSGVMGRVWNAAHSGVIGYNGSNIGSLGTGGMGASGYSPGGYGVYGSTSSGYAGYFHGDVHVTGTLSKAFGSFVIDHPLEPQNKILRHMFVESPEALCIYRGKIALDASGEAIVALPSYFAALTKENEATVSLTSVGRPFLTGYEWLPDYSGFRVYGDPGREISWVAYADRDDPAARKLARPVEEEKGPDNKLCDRGKLLNP